MTVVLLAVAELTLSSADGIGDVETSEYLYVASIILSALSCCIIIWLRGGRRAFPSTIIFMSWLLTAALHLPAFLVIIENNFYNTSAADACQALLMTVFILLTLSECVGGSNSDNEDGSSLMSVLTFGWMTPLMRIGFRRELSEEDMPTISESVRLDQIMKRFGQHYNNNNNNKSQSDLAPKVSFLNCILRTFVKDIIIVAFFRISTDLIYFAGPQILRQFIRVLETDDFAWKGN